VEFGGRIWDLNKARVCLSLAGAAVSRNSREPRLETREAEYSGFSFLPFSFETKNSRIQVKKKEQQDFQFLNK
jgi:hypothetical protein